jgi:SAM-dependent methyltransferase
LQKIHIEQWKDHPLLQNQYDLFLCSHVLEHLPDPPGFLNTVRRCLKADGIFLGLVPVNERAVNPHHLHAVDRSVVEGWARNSGYELTYYEENDPFLYWIQPLYALDYGWRRYLGQGVRLICGIPSRILGERVWYGALAPLVALFSKPTQAVFILRRVKSRP